MREKLPTPVSSSGSRLSSVRVVQSANPGSQPRSWTRGRIVLLAITLVLTLPAMLWARELRTEWVAGGSANSALSFVLVLWIGCGIATLVAATFASTARRLYGWVEESFPDVQCNPWVLIGTPVIFLCLGISGLLFAEQPTRWHGGASQVGTKRSDVHERRAVRSGVRDEDAEMIYRQFERTNPELSGPDDVKRAIDAAVEASHRR